MIGVLVVGVLVPPKKQALWMGILENDESSEGQQVKYLFGEDGVEAADIVLSKVSDFCCESNPVLEILDKKKLNAPVITLVEHQRMVADRFTMMHKIASSGLGIRTPITFAIPSEASAVFSVSSPKWIVKPRAACGPAWTHRMAIVSSPAQVEEIIFTSSSGFPFACEFVLQELIPHNGWFLKIFVIGTDIFAFRRRSIDGSENNVFSASDLKFLDDCCGVFELPVSPELRRIAESLSQVFQFDLFGADIVPSSDGELFVVDVNYFPTYAELGSRRKKLLDEYLVGKAKSMGISVGGVS